MPELLKFIQAYLSNANMRGVDPENPIPFLVRAPEGQPNQGKQFIIQVGYTEPTFNQLPYNVLWICFDKALPYYAKLYRRITHHTNALTPDLRYTWEELTDYSQIFEKEQYYMPVADLGLTDSDTQVDPILVASESSFGTVKTISDEVEPRAVLTEDERLSNDRESIAHVHANTARTMLKLFTYSVPVLDENGEQVIIDEAPVSEMKRGYLKVDGAFPPQPNELLFIDRKDDKTENVWHAVWRQPKAEDILDIGASLTAIEILEPTDEYGDNQNYQLQLKLVWSDLTETVADAGVTWTVSDNSQSIAISSEGGLIVVPDISEDTLVTVTAKYSNKGKEFTDTVDVLLKDTYVPVTPTGIAITGQSSVNETETANYVVTLTRSDGNTEVVTPDSFVSNNTSAAIIEVDGVLTTYDVDQNENVTITAQYTVEGQTFSATFDLVVVDLQSVSGLEIRGVTTMDELTSTSFEVFVNYGDNTSVKVTPETFLIKTGGDHASLSGFELTANDVVNDQTVVLEATYTAKGQPLTASQTVTITDLSIYPVGLVVTSLPTMDENATQAITVGVTMTDASVVDIPVPDSILSSDASIVVKGLDLESQTVLADTDVTISVKHRYDGVDFDKDVYVKVLNSESIATGFEVTGPTSVNEEANINLSLKHVNDDGSKTPITDFTSLTITQAPAGLLTITETAPTVKVEATAHVTVDTDVTITFTYVHGEDTWVETHVVTLVNSMKTEVEWRVVGPNPVNVGLVAEENYAYQLQIDFDDGSQATKNALDWRIQDNAKVTVFDKDTGKIAFLMSEGDVLADQKFTIEGKYNLSGAFEWRPLEVTIEPMDTSLMTLALWGNTTIDEGQTTTSYAPKISYKSLWNDFGTLTGLSIVGETYGCTIIGGNKVQVPSNLAADRSLTLVGTFDWRGETGLTTEEFTLILNDTIPNFQSAVFKPTKTVFDPTEEIDPTIVQYTLSDNSKHSAVAKSITLTEGASAVDVTGTGSATRFTVKSDNAATTSVKWSGVVEVDGVDHPVTLKTVTANKFEAPPEFPYVAGVLMAPAFTPTVYENDITTVIKYYNEDKNAREFTDAMAEGVIEFSYDVQGYPDDTSMPEKPWTAYIIYKTAWGTPTMIDKATDRPIVWLGICAPVDDWPSEENSIRFGEPGFPFESHAVDFEGESYSMIRFQFPKSSIAPNSEHYSITFSK